MKNRIQSCLGFLFAFSLSALLSSSAVRADDSRLGVTVYAEEGQWFTQLFTVDPEGWPDTLERRAFPSEREARDRLRELTASLGAEEIDPDLKNTPALRELRIPDTGEIWVAENAWNEDWEKKFADWTLKNFDRDFFVRYNIETDCADAAVALRWIFSRVMKLPAGNRLIGDTALLSNRSVRKAWKDLPTNDDWSKDQRFLAALNYVLVNTYTHTLHADSYPIAISPDYLTEGSFHLEMRQEDGHTRVMTKIIHSGHGYPIRDMWSNVPRKVRRLVEEPFTVYQQPPLNFGGFRRHLWVQLGTSATFVKPADMPGYSLEQYQPDFFKHGVDDFSAEVSSRLQEVFDPVLALEAIYSNVITAVEERKKLVDDGYAVCVKEDCSPGTGNYENWSTPSRDARLLSSFQQIQSYLKTLTGDDLTRFQKKYAKYEKKKIIKLDGHKYRFSEIEAIWLAGKYSSNPTDVPKVRWGI